MKRNLAGFRTRKLLVFSGVFLVGMIWAAGFLSSCGVLPNTAGCYDYCAYDEACMEDLYCWKETCVPIECESCFCKDKTCEFTYPELDIQYEESQVGKKIRWDRFFSSFGYCQFLECGNPSMHNFVLTEGCWNYYQEGHVICAPSTKKQPLTAEESPAKYD